MYVCLHVYACLAEFTKKTGEVKLKIKIDIKKNLRKSWLNNYISIITKLLSCVYTYLFLF